MIANQRYTLNDWNKPDKIIDNEKNKELTDIEEICEILNTNEATIQNLLNHKDVQSSTNWELKYWDEVQDKMALEEHISIIYETIDKETNKLKNNLEKNTLKQPQLQYTKMKLRQLEKLKKTLQNNTRGLSPITSYKIGEDYYLLTIEGILEAFKPTLTHDDLIKLKAEIISMTMKNKLWGKV